MRARHLGLLFAIPLAVPLLAAASAHAQSAQLQKVRGVLLASHSQQCLRPFGPPGVGPCSDASFFQLIPIAGSRSEFQLRRDRDNACLAANRDGHFEWTTCAAASPGSIDQHWSWLPSSEARGEGEMLRAVHSRSCLFSNSDGRFGLYACTDEYTDQRWQILSRPPATRRAVVVIPPPQPPELETPQPLQPVPPPRRPPVLTKPERVDDAQHCDKDGDCMIFCPRVSGCCGWPCGCRNAIRRDAAASFEKEYARTCQRPPCPAVGCALEEAMWAQCRGGRCVPVMH